jgi:cytochrome c oxidase subunit 2
MSWGGRTRRNCTNDDDRSGSPGHRWEHLTNEDHAEEHGEQHPTYTRETFERAVTEGLDPEGEELHWMMPRWDMTQAQLDDLIAFLQTLD